MLREVSQIWLSIGEVFGNDKENVLLMFFNNVSSKESNEIEVLAILEILHLFYSSLQGRLIMESDSSNNIS